MKRLLMLVGKVKHETSNIIEETVSTYNIFKGGIFEEVNKGTTCALGSEKYINRRTRFCSSRVFCRWDLTAVVNRVFTYVIKPHIAYRI